MLRIVAQKVQEISVKNNINGTFKISINLNGNVNPVDSDNLSIHSYEGVYTISVCKDREHDDHDGEFEFKYSLYVRFESDHELSQNEITNDCRDLTYPLLKTGVSALCGVSMIPEIFLPPIEEYKD